MTKDRLAALRAAQEDADEPTVVIVAADEKSKPIDEFYSEVEEIRDNIEETHSFIEEVKRIHSAILSSTQTENKLEKQLENVMDDIKRNANRIRNKLKKMNEKIELMEQTAATSAEYRIRKTQHSMLHQKFSEVMSEYNKIQTDYRERCKAHIQRLLEIRGKPTTSEELEQMLESGNVEVFTEGFLARTQQERQTLADIEARHLDIVKLEKSIKELHDMFTDMAAIVEQQGDMINRIEFHVTKTKNYVEKGKQETGQALVYQKKSRRKKVYIIICLVILAVVIIASVVPSVMGDKPKSAQSKE